MLRYTLKLEQHTLYTTIFGFCLQCEGWSGIFVSLCVYPYRVTFNANMRSSASWVMIQIYNLHKGGKLTTLFICTLMDVVGFCSICHGYRRWTMQHGEQVGYLWHWLMNQLLPHISNLSNLMVWGKGDEYHQSLSLSLPVLQKTRCCVYNLVKLIDQDLPHPHLSSCNVDITRISIFLSSALR
jgi:hypothetical protein